MTKNPDPSQQNERNDKTTERACADDTTAHISVGFANSQYANLFLTEYTQGGAMERVLRRQENELQWEAAIWRATRHRRRANELTWISAEHKAQILRALRPEMSG